MCVRGSWTPNRTAIYWPPLLWPSVFLSRSPDVAQPEAWGPTSLDVGFLYRIMSPTDLVSKLTDFLSSLSYLIVHRPLNLWNGMFHRHQAEITVMLFSGHSLPVHQSMTVPRDFTLFHIVIQARLRDFFP